MPRLKNPEWYDQQIDRLKQERSQALKREREKKRKERTKRLIEKGAYLEKVIGENTDVEIVPSMHEVYRTLEKVLGHPLSNGDVLRFSQMIENLEYQYQGYVTNFMTPKH